MTIDNDGVRKAIEELLLYLPHEQSQSLSTIFRYGYDIGYKSAISDKQRDIASQKNENAKIEKERAREEWVISQVFKPYNLRIKEYKSNKTLAAHIKEKHALKTKQKTIENWISEFNKK